MAIPSGAPKRDHTLTLRDGRTLAYAEWGPSGGRPVVLLHGMPGSRRLCPDVEATEDAGVRLLTIDRPGYGGSTPQPGRTVLSWVDDFVEWADAIALGPCPVLGWSSGGAYALACAHMQPDRVTNVGLLSADGPLDEVPGALEAEPDEVRRLTDLMRRDVVAARPEIEERCQWFADGWSAMLEPSGTAADDVLLRDDAVATAMRALMGEGARQGIAGYVDDWIAESRPWGFALGDITHETHVWWGTEDELVGRPHADALAAGIPRAELRVLPDEGHLLLISRWRDILAATR